MREFWIPDVEFSELLARWVFQSQLANGKSGGESHSDEEGEGPPLSLDPLKVGKCFSAFTSKWEKQPYFSDARPLLSRVFTAASMAFGKSWRAKLPAAKLWYRIGVHDVGYLMEAGDALLKMKKPLVLYGRDCLPLYRAMQGICRHVYYLEGMSRPVFKYSVHTRTNCVRGYFRDNIPKQVWGHFVHVDTGFVGSVPRRVHESIDVIEGNSMPSVLPYSRLRMLSSRTEEIDLGIPRDEVIKREYRPKMFYRPTGWMMHDTYRYRYRPDLKVSGDAFYAACYLIGIMAASAEWRREERKNGYRVDMHAGEAQPEVQKEARGNPGWIGTKIDIPWDVVPVATNWQAVYIEAGTNKKISVISNVDGTFDFAG